MSLIGNSGTPYMGTALFERQKAGRDQMLVAGFACHLPSFALNMLTASFMIQYRAICTEGWGNASTLFMQILGLTVWLRVASCAAGCWPAMTAEQVPNTSGEFANGFPNDLHFFPIGVWLQNPRNASAYKAIGINTFVATWETPTAEQLAQLKQYGLFAIVEPNATVLSLPNADVIRAWMQTDEPDNAQPDGRGGFGDCLMPEEVVRRYKAVRALDSTRPVFLNFGQGVANSTWFGRGAKCSRISPKSYYAAASRGADIVSFDIYPVAEERQKHVMGKLELVGRGVTNLKTWSEPTKPVWAAIETTHINNPLADRARRRSAARCG